MLIWKVKGLCQINAVDEVHIMEKLFMFLYVKRHINNMLDGEQK